MFESPYSRIRNIDWKPKSNEELLTQDGMKPFSLRVRWRSDLEYKWDFLKLFLHASQLARANKDLG
jgi:hypothetical protein